VAQDDDMSAQLSCGGVVVTLEVDGIVDEADVEGIEEVDVEGTVGADVEGIEEVDVEGTVGADVEGIEEVDVEGTVGADVKLPSQPVPTIPTVENASQMSAEP